MKSIVQILQAKRIVEARFCGIRKLRLKGTEKLSLSINQVFPIPMEPASRPGEQEI